MENPEVAARRFYFDRSLIAALVDRWRPETHTFHLPCGEMTPTLQDVSYLLGLSCAGAAVGVIDMQADWINDMHQRFGPVERKADAPPTCLSSCPMHEGQRRSGSYSSRYGTIQPIKY